MVPCKINRDLIKPGDKLLVMEHVDFHSCMLTPNRAVDDWAGASLLPHATRGPRSHCAVNNGKCRSIFMNILRSGVNEIGNLKGITDVKSLTALVCVYW